MLGLLVAAAARATVWTGGDLGGDDLVLADGDHLTGTFTGVDELRIPAGARVTADVVRVEARAVSIEGDLVADGLGSAGGVLGDGEGPGAGRSPTDGDGGAGGGGHGGAGGDGAAFRFDASGAGGPLVGDDALTAPEPGSGGGAGTEDAGGAGGAGGASWTSSPPGGSP